MTEALPVARRPRLPDLRLGERFGPAAVRAQGALQRLAAVVGRPLGVVTGAGWIVLAIAVVATGAGLLLGVGELLVAGVAAAVVLIAAVPLSAGRSDLDVRVDLGAGRVVAGEIAAGALQIRNRGRHGTRATRLEVPVGPAVGVLDVPALAPDADHEPLFEIPTTRRSVIVVGPVAEARQDPFGLVRRTSRRSEPAVLHVHPRTIRVDGPADGLIRDLEGVETRARTTSDIAFHALRGYVPGDDRRAIHWRTTARTGKMMVREFEEVRRSHLALGLAAELGDYSSNDEFELAVSVAGSLARAALDDGHPASVVAHARVLDSRSSGTVLDALSGLERGTGKEASTQSTARSLAALVPQASLAVLIVGAASTPESVRAAALRLPPSARHAAIVVGGEEASLGAIGDLALLRVARLEDVPVAAGALAG